MDEESQFAHFESMGETHVRDIAMQWDVEMRLLAYKWLRAKDHERDLRISTSNAEQMRMARTAKNAAVVAAIAAIITIPLAIIAIIISYLAWRQPLL